MPGKELIEIAILHVLGDHAERVLSDTHSQETNDVGILQPGHDLYLLEKIIPLEDTDQDKPTG